MDYHFSTTQITVFVLLAIWDLAWKAFAMWRAVKRREPGWFVAILVLNTVGVLPIAYLLLTDKEKKV